MEPTGLSIGGGTRCGVDVTQLHFTVIEKGKDGSLKCRL
jgi:hypothetical protein